MRKGQIAIIAACIFAVILLLSSWMLFSYYADGKKQAQEFYALAHIAEQAEPV